jgi:serine protease inhibitor
MKTKFLLCLALVLGGVSSIHIGTAYAAPLPEVQEVVASNTAFAVDLYDQLRRHDGNLCFSPYSISTALAMTYGGARGETAAQMAQTLHFNLPPDRLNRTFALLGADIRAVQKKGQVQLAEANSLWPQKGFTFLPDYLALCRKYYDTSITPVDYIMHTEAARKTINAWVEAKTNRKVVELLKPGMLDSSNRLVLVNAIYFKGHWASQFEARLTEDKTFYVNPWKTVTASLMQQTHQYHYAEFPALQVLELPYVGDELSMVVLLPRQMDGIGQLENELTTQNLAAWTANLRNQKVAVFLPKFKVQSEFSLADTLRGMGMPDAFVYGHADFSGMDGLKDLFIGAVSHEAFVDVNEEGTEAAAATAVTMIAGEAFQPLPVFCADHPFLFLIRDNRDGSILFLGRVTDPTQ